MVTVGLNAEAAGEVMGSLIADMHVIRLLMLKSYRQILVVLFWEGIDNLELLHALLARLSTGWDALGSGWLRLLLLRLFTLLNQ